MQEMLEFCAGRGIAAEIEMIPIQKIEEGSDRLEWSDVKYRFVIDSTSLAAG
jgi:alcohol dehydrogenase (NADP+)